MSEVTVYGKPGCRPCAFTKRFLDDNGVDYEYFDVTQDAAAAQLIIDKGFKAVPVVFAPNATWNGLDEAKLEELVASK